MLPSQSAVYLGKAGRNAGAAHLYLLLDNVYKVNASLLQQCM